MATVVSGLPKSLFTDGDGAFPRLRVDPAATSFYAGREYRTFQKLTIAAGATASIRATVPIDIILEETSFYAEGSPIEVQLKVGGTAAGPWTAMTVIRKSTMTITPVITNQLTLDYDGSHTGGVLIDILRVPAGNKLSSVGGSSSVRGVGPGTYYYVITNTGVQDAIVIFSGQWEEHPGPY